jgi:hypothetical protein
MRTILILAVFSMAGAMTAQSAPLPSCAIQKAREVSFRNATSKDVLEVSIGTGPCYHSTLTIVIRTRDEGHILYSYVQQFGQHVSETSESPELIAEATRFVEFLIAQGLGSTAALPPWLPPEQYEQDHQSHLSVTREVYENLRARPRPILAHPTYHEGWKSVVFDEKNDKAMEVLTGGT